MLNGNFKAFSKTLLILISLLGMFDMFQSKLIKSDPLDKVNSIPLINNFIIAVHGGAGSYNRSKITLEKEVTIKTGILEALKAGYEMLLNNGTHMEATREAIVKMEDNPLFNAGKGGKLNRKFEVEMDASIMDGSTLKCGAVASVKHIKNPIKGAELIMRTTPHIMLISDAADEYAKENGLEYMPNYYFFTLDRIEEWYAAKDKYNKTISDKLIGSNNTDSNDNPDFNLSKKGTIGAVAKDNYGHLSAATSTGGTTYKMAGRVGDSPIIGAGNYANDETCAVSCTGEGETMMRKLISFDVHARMLYKNISLQESSQEVMSSLPENTGGFISIDKFGNVEMPYNSAGMARGFVRNDGKAYVYIFDKDNDITPIEYDLNLL